MTTVLRTRVIGQLSGDQVMMTPAIQTPSNPTVVDYNNIALDQITRWLSLLTPLATSMVDSMVWTLIQVALIDLFTGDETNIIDAFFNVTGSISQDAMPNYVAANVDMVVQGNPRKAKAFIPGFAEQNSEGNTIDPGLIVKLATFANDWSAPFLGSASGFTYTPGMWSPTGLQFFETAGIISAKVPWSHQAKRKLGRGV